MHETRWEYDALDGVWFGLVIPTELEFDDEWYELTDKQIETIKKIVLARKPPPGRTTIR